MSNFLIVMEDLKSSLKAGTSKTVRIYERSLIDDTIDIKCSSLRNWYVLYVTEIIAWYGILIIFSVFMY